MSPKMAVYTSALGLVGSASSSAFGDTITVSVSGVKAGQTFLIRAGGYSAGSSTGGFGIELNFGSVYQPPIAPPNTVVPQQPDRGGGTQNPSNQTIIIGNFTTVGNLLHDQPAARLGIIGSTTTPVSLAATQPAGNVAAIAVVSTLPQSSAAPLAGGTGPAEIRHNLGGWSAPVSKSSTYQAIDSVILGLTPRNRLSLFTKGTVPGRHLPV